MHDVIRKRARGQGFSIFLGVFLALFGILAWEAASGNGSYTWASETDSEKGSVHRVRIQDGQRRLAVDARGEIEIAPDERSISRLGPDAMLEIEEKTRRERRRLEVTPGPGGEPAMVFFVDRRRVEMDDDARDWLAKMLPWVYRATGLDAEARVGRLLAGRGVPGVLDEIEKIGNDGIERLYFEHLMAQAELDDSDLERVLRRVAQEIGSDYEMRQLLTGLPVARLTNPPAASAFVAAAKTIGSDYELHQVLAACLGRPGLDSEIVAAILDAARTIGSDYELAELLVELTRTWPGELPPSYFRLLSSIGSDYELRRTLSAAVARPGLTRETAAALLDASSGIGSDYELATFLIELSEIHPIDAAIRPDFDRALATIGSSHERERVLAAL